MSSPRIRAASATLRGLGGRFSGGVGSIIDVLLVEALLRAAADRLAMRAASNEARSTPAASHAPK
jgi:hypothetical protein